MKKITFIAHVELFHNKGHTTKTNRVYGLSPKEQRALLEMAILGYDPHNPDSDNYLKFSAPAPTPEAKPEERGISVIHYSAGSED